MKFITVVTVVAIIIAIMIITTIAINIKFSNESKKNVDAKKKAIALQKEKESRKQLHIQELADRLSSFSKSNKEKEAEIQEEKENRWKYIKIVKRTNYFDSLLEHDTFNMLRHEFGGSIRIDTHVHLNEIFRVDDSEEETYFNKLWTTHVDFVVSNRKNPADVYFAIEVDAHNSHRDNDATILNDAFKTRVFEENNIPLIRVAGVDNMNYKPFESSTYPEKLLQAFDFVKSENSCTNERNSASI